MTPINEHRYYRISEIVKPNGFFPVASSTWWAGVKTGRYPKPIKLGPRLTAWSGADLNALIVRLNSDDE